MTKILACTVDEIEVGAVKQVEIDGRDPVALYRLDDGYFATDDICTHGAAFLSEGDIDDGEIYCPFHAGAFDIRTGEASVAPCVIDIRSYPTVIEGNEVFVDLTEQKGDKQGD